jgi:uncharacterized RDD family membrane protein YckC/RNA polymerase subunit RPABC4/transcription elongation factor Spt4
LNRKLSEETEQVRKKGAHMVAISCPRCGTAATGDTRSCAACGADFETDRAAIGTRPGMRACPWCETHLAPTARSCPSCGHDFAAELPEAGGILPRFVAVLIDGIIVAIPAFIAFGAAPDFTTGLVLYYGVGVVYSVGFWTIAGATPGKMVFGLRVVMKDGSPITGGAAVMRYVGYIVTNFTLGLGLLIAFFNRDKRPLHDFIGGTKIVNRR